MPTAKQSEFLRLECREAFYGGAAGGAKSSALLMAALQFVDVPGYAAILFRRTYADLALPGALMDRASDWLGPTDAHWNGLEHTWTFPSGATISFGYLDHDKAKYRYGGAEFQFVGFDELTEFEERQYIFLFSRLRRRSGVEVPLRMRGASNPGGTGHDWCYRRFIVEGPAAGRVFISARLQDNPHIDQASYELTLANLDAVTRAQLLEGDWNVRPNDALFQRHWFAIVEAMPIDIHRKVRYWDLAATEAKKGQDPDWTVGILLGQSMDHHFWVLDVRRVRSAPGDVQRLVRQTAEMDGRSVPIIMEEEGGAAGKTLIHIYLTTVLPGWNFRGERVSGDKVTRAQPLAAQAQVGNVKLMRSNWNKDFLDEFEAFPFGAHDDIVDACSGGFRNLTANPAASPPQCLGGGVRSVNPFGR